MSDVARFISEVQPERRRDEAARLDTLFQRETGFQPKLWSGGMLGYGQYDYTYKSGHSGTWFATGFAPRKARLSIYIMPGYADFGDILARLGKHKIGKSCLYLNKLDDADIDVLAELVRAGLKDLATKWDIKPS